MDLEINIRELQKRIDRACDRANRSPEEIAIVAVTKGVTASIIREAFECGLRNFGYDSESRTLEIEFHSGGVYQYFAVPQSIYDELMRASSHGTFFHRNIKDKYRYTKIQ